VTQLHDIPLSEIHMDEQFNCRGPIAPIDVVDLAKDIEQRGLIQPVTIAPYPADKQKELGYKYRLIAGYRRFTAHKILKKATVSAIIRQDMQDEAAARFFNLSENIQRKDLNILQEAQAISRLREIGVTEHDAANKLGKSRGWIQVRYMLLDLPQEIQQEVAAGFISQAQIRELYTIHNISGKNKCMEAAKKLKEARQNGRVVSVNPNKTAPKAKRHRKRDEIFLMMEHIQDNVGNSFATRCMSWAAGEISDEELFGDVRKLCDDAGKVYIAFNAVDD
jgi:ParB/RepB/Spo0J family partition protein